MDTAVVKRKGRKINQEKKFSGCSNNMSKQTVSKLSECLPSTVSKLSSLAFVFIILPLRVDSR